MSTLMIVMIVSFIIIFIVIGLTIWTTNRAYDVLPSLGEVDPHPVKKDERKNKSE